MLTRQPCLPCVIRIPPIARASFHLNERVFYDGITVDCGSGGCIAKGKCQRRDEELGRVFKQHVVILRESSVKWVCLRRSALLQISIELEEI